MTVAQLRKELDELKIRLAQQQRDLGTLAEALRRCGHTQLRIVSLMEHQQKKLDHIIRARTTICKN